MNRTRITTAIVAAVFVSLAIASCGASTPEVTPAASGADSSAPAPEVTTPAPAPEPTEEATAGTREAPLALGETRQLAEKSGWIVGMSAANYDGLAALRAEYDGTEAPTSGNNFVIGTLQGAVHEDIMEQTDLAETGVSPGYSLTVTYVTAGGTSYSEYSGSSDDYCYTNNQLSSVGDIFAVGATFSGDVCFSVPTEEIPGGMWRISNPNNDAVWVQGAE